MKKLSYEYSDYNINNCIKTISRWMQAQVTEISKGDIWVDSIHIEPHSSGNVYHLEKWSLRINYTEKERK